MTESKTEDPYSVIARDYLYPVDHELFYGFHARIVEKVEEDYEDDGDASVFSTLNNGEANDYGAEDSDDPNTIQVVCDAVALYDFEPLHENELGVSEGQTICIISEASHGWLVAYDEFSGGSGLVPESYVNLIR
ncbi:Shk1 kinase binding protein 5 [Schizosaccharomyces octosporus yFS286]|uniref:Shk1 kinase binding protein 5 n=1 Tax=Schizosaccharomyces octosporus (strain yFS286) TaxID=483514 RepID=S9PX69_SCHOY|nr:Shk1 kinase binding protein 5 [Schizosaccharomyces octosporus yFS286]EPX72058.1 Shk1 kinase binding protein 5 [Schizosaccharomyces octosporus yFS286]